MKATDARLDENPTVRAVVVAEAPMDADGGVVLFQDTTQIGEVAKLVVKVIVQVIVPPEPMVTVPRLSLPVIEGLVPQLPTVGVAPRKAICPVN